MPWVAPDEIAYEYEAAPFTDRVKLPSRPARRMDLFEKKPGADPLPALSSTAETATELIRPSLCVQAREGRLHVFLPYASQARGLSRPGRCRRGHVPASAEAGVAGGLRSAFRSAAAIVQRYSRSRRSRSKPSAREQLERTRTDQHSPLRGSAPKPLDR